MKVIASISSSVVAPLADKTTVKGFLSFLIMSITESNAYSVARDFPPNFNTFMFIFIFY